MKLDQLIEHRDVLATSEAAELISDGLLYSASGMEYIGFIIAGLALLIGVLFLFDKNSKKYGAGVIVFAIAFGSYPSFLASPLPEKWITSQEGLALNEIRKYHNKEIIKSGEYVSRSTIAYSTMQSTMTIKQAEKLQRKLSLLGINNTNFDLALLDVANNEIRN